MGLELDLEFDLVLEWALVLAQVLALVLEWALELVQVLALVLELALELVLVLEYHKPLKGLHHQISCQIDNREIYL